MALGDIAKSMSATIGHVQAGGARGEKMKV